LPFTPMPRLPTLRTRVLHELARQLRFESADAARRQLARAEELALQLLDESGKGDAPESYPEEWVVFRVTGLRTEPGAGGDGNGTIARRELLSDLPGLIDRLSAAAKLTENDLAPPAVKPKRSGAKTDASGAVGSAGDRWLTLDDLCRRWDVSRKTLERYRRMGLTSRRVQSRRGTRGGAERVVYSEAAVRAFERANRERIAEAGEFGRMDAAARARVLRRAGRYRRVLGWSRFRTAQRLAAQEGRSVEAIRKMLCRHDERSEKPIFDEPGILDSSQRAGLERASRRGGNLSAAAEQVRKSRASVYRVVGERRAERLRGLELRGPVGPAFARKDAAEVVLSHAAARKGLGCPGAANVAELLRMAAGIGPEDAAVETARAAAYWYLIWLARRGVESLPRHGAKARTGEAGLDVIETRLLWASRIKAEIVRSQLPLLVRTIESQAGFSAQEIPGLALRELCAVGLEAMIEAADRFDPFKGGRLAAPMGVGVTRAISQWLRANADAAGLRSKPGTARRTSPKADLALLVLDDWAVRVNPWQEWLEPAAAARAGRAGLAARERGVLEMRFGWSGHPPRTLEETAREFKTTPTRITAIQRSAIAKLMGGPVGARRRVRKAAK